MTTELEPRVCPACGAEYRPTITHCADCGDELVSHSELAAHARAVGEFPPVSELVCVRVAPLAWTRLLSETLESDGIAHRVEGARPGDAPEGQNAQGFGDVDLFGLHVKEQNLPTAREIDEHIAEQMLPDEGTADPGEEDDVCPACGAALGSSDAECSDCGLTFG